MSPETDTQAAPLPTASPEAIQARKQALIDAGTDPLVAGKLAEDCEAQQAHRDALNAASSAAPAKKGGK